MTQTAPRSKRPRDRRRTIELAASELFATRGFAATGLADIAAKVGVTPAALYRHFAGKDELLETIILGSLQRVGRTAQEAVARTDTAAPEHRLRGLLSALIDTDQASPHAVIVYMRERHRLTGDARAGCRDAEARIANRIRSCVLEVRPEVSAFELNARLRAMNGVLAAAAVQRHVVPLHRLRALFVDGLVGVLLSPHDPAMTIQRHEPSSWEPPATRRTAILDAAAKLFRQYGYHGASIDQIGEAAGIAGPTVYGTYPSKVDILVDAVDYAVIAVEVLTNRALSHAASPSEAIESLARSYAETIVTNIDIMAMAAREISNVPDADRARIRRRQQDYRQRAEAVLLGVRPTLTDADAHTLLAGAYALVSEVAHARDTPSTESIAQLMVTFLCASA
jgi:AcrR family transcriptional regulator